MKTQISQTDLELIQGDITKAPVEAIVNAANSALVGGVVWTGQYVAPVVTQSNKPVQRFVPVRGAVLPVKQLLRQAAIFTQNM